MSAFFSVSVQQAAPTDHTLAAVLGTALLLLLSKEVS